MSEIEDYFPPLIGRKKINFKKIFFPLTIIWHALTPHESAKGAKKKIKGDFFNLKDEQIEPYYNSCLQMYQESKARISKLEEKAFKLVSYISALSALLVFFLGQNIELFTKVSVLTAITVLVLALIISLRCVGIKTQYSTHFTTLFSQYTKGDSLVLKNRREICADLCNFTIYNQNVADNTADILKGARYMLTIGIFTTALSLISYFVKMDNTPSNVSTPSSSIHVLSDSLKFDSIEYQIGTQNRLLLEISEKLDSLKLMVNDTVLFNHSIVTDTITK